MMMIFSWIFIVIGIIHLISSFMEKDETIKYSKRNQGSIALIFALLYVCLSDNERILDKLNSIENSCVQEKSETK